MLQVRERSVLVADDTANIRDLVASAFKDAGCSVFTVEGGNDAAAVLGREKVDLVVTDLRMEKGTGIELIRRLRRQKRAGSAIPEIVVYTGLCSQEGEGYLKSLGAREVFLKELSPRKLVERLKELGIL